jgi:predicted DCC family thiol-disulfide oxidoreductase YuxK
VKSTLTETASGKDIILFDGDCNFCTGWVIWTIKRDKKDRFRFCAMQTDKGRQVLNDAGQSSDSGDSVVLIREGNIYKRSDAALRIFAGLGGLYKLINVFLIVPGVIRNGIYDFIASRRYKWYGKRESCYLPDEKIRSKFL